jgi:hypothetical protein
MPSETATTTAPAEMATTPAPPIDAGVLDAPTGAPPSDAGDHDASDAAEAGGPVLAPEVGFFDVPAQPTAATYEARLFYVFQPADADAAHKPIFVLSNGGPGSATTAGLVAYGTGRYSLDANAEAGAPPAVNPSSWTSFANLLYIDSRQAGFSYGLGATTTPGCTFSEVEDASDFVRALLEFFDAHPSLRASPVVVGGESYAGTRANWMLDLLLRYGTEASQGGSDLQAKIQAHFDAIFPGLAGTVIDQATASQQFGAQVLIEPLVLGQEQYAQQSKLLATNPYVGPSRDGGNTGVDPYDTQQPNGWFDATLAHAMTALSAVGPAAELLGADLRSIPLLQPAARAGSFHGDSTLTAVLPAETTANATLATLLGALTPGDEYYASLGAACTRTWQPSDTGDNAFLYNLRTVKTFITDARYDGAILSLAIPAVFAAANFGGVVDSSPRAGVDRPGWFTVDIPAQADAGTPAQTVEVRFPPYDQSGHSVAVSQPADLAADVQAWLTGP